MIRENIERILKEIPPYVEIVAATKKRSIPEILEAIDVGIKIIGENYVQDAERKYEVIGKRVSWHLIGHLQRNKVKRAVRLFDMIQTLDSLELAGLIDRECKKIGKIMPALVEINIAGEPQKSGILPQNLEEFIGEVVRFKNLRLCGLMTMGPWMEDPCGLRPYFKEAKRLFDRVSQIYGDTLDWRYLSMGMSSSYRVAIEEGANMVRLGTVLFGPRE
jgi:hypothetical protein